jgi:hypothetical protein
MPLCTKVLEPLVKLNVTSLYIVDSSLCEYPNPNYYLHKDLKVR